MNARHALILGSLVGLACGAAQAAPEDASDELRRNGAVSRHLWVPEAATADVAGLRVSAGVALGLRGPLRTQLGARLAPSVQFAIDRRSSVAILASGRGGAAIVWQRTD